MTEPVTPLRAVPAPVAVTGADVLTARASAVAAASPHTVESGTAAVSSTWFGGLIDEAETTSELQWPRSLAIYDAMRRTDAQVKSVLRAVKMPILRAEWLIDPASADADVVQLVAADLGLQVKGADPVALPRSRDRFSFRKHLGQALQYLEFGHMPFEIVYRIDEAGRARLRKLGPRSPRTLANIKTAPDGGLVSITQRALDGQGAEIPVEHLVMYVFEPDVEPWLGMSMLRPAYKNWVLKDASLRIQAQTNERNGMGVPRYTGAEKETDLSGGRKIAAAWRSGDGAGAAIPFGAKLDLVGVTGTLPDLDKAIRYHDEQIARAVLAHFLNLGTQTGSWALGSTFADFFSLSLQAIADDLADTFTQHVVEDIVDVNFGHDVPAPRVVCSPIGSKRDATADAIKTLIDAGALTSDEDLERFVRSVYGLPAPGGAALDTTPPAGGNA